MDLLGHYKLIEKIAQGGMAEIYKAETYDPNGLKRHVVIKRILPHVASHQEFIDMLIDEAKIAVLFNHGNIAQIYDLAKIGSDYFIVMEYVEGKTLQHIFKRAEALKQKIPIPYCLFFISELCAGLSYMHRKTDASGKSLNVVHRDISPQNIIVTFSGNVKIIDFGIAKAEDKLTVTESGVLKGKFAYMSPEQAVGDDLDARSDIFAAGIILWELIAAERLFRRKNNKETLKAVKKADVPALADYNPAVPKELDKAVRKALARSLRKRYSDAADLQADLTRILHTHYPDFQPSLVSTYLESLFLATVPAQPVPVKAVSIKPDEADKTRREKILPHAPPAQPPLEVSDEVTQRRPLPLADLSPPQLEIEVGEETRRVKVSDIDLSPVIHHGAAPAGHDPEAQEATRLYRPEVPLPEDTPDLPESPHRERSDSALLHSSMQDSLVSSSSSSSSSSSLSSAPLQKDKTRQAIAVVLVVLLASLFGWLALHDQTPPAPKPPIAEPVVAIKPPPVSPPLPKQPATGTLMVESTPPGADIFIDDKQTGRVTPAVFTDLAAGASHRVGVSLNGTKYQEHPAAIVAGQQASVHAVLERNLANFSFITEPPGALVHLNGVRIGQTPVLNYALEPDTIVDLSYTKAGFENWSGHFKVYGGEHKQIVQKLKALPEKN